MHQRERLENWKQAERAQRGDERADPDSGFSMETNDRYAGDKQPGKNEIQSSVRVKKGSSQKIKLIGFFRVVVAGVREQQRRTKTSCSAK